MSSFENAHRVISNLAKDFLAHERRYLSAGYQDAEVRKDFIDKFWKALGWDVDHDTQKNPYEQEVKGAILCGYYTGLRLPICNGAP